MGYRYLGSKARVVEEILDVIGSPTSTDGRFIDAFSGTGIVASIAADRGWNVGINDMMSYACILSESRLISQKEIYFNNFGGYPGIIDYLNSLQGLIGTMTKLYSPESKSYCGIERRYFTVENAMKIDAITQKIHSLYNDKEITHKEFVLLAADVMLSTNTVANIAGTYGCFLSHWSSAAQSQFKLLPHKLRENKIDYQITQSDVFDLVCKEDDVIYFDPPYTKRQYASYYHILETIACGDEPIVSGTSGLRPWKDKSSVFCYKIKALDALVKLITSQNSKRVYLSYSDEGHVKLEDLKQRLNEYGTVIVHSLGKIARYCPNTIAIENNNSVIEYLVEFRRN